MRFEFRKKDSEVKTFACRFDNNAGNILLECDKQCGTKLFSNYASKLMVHTSVINRSTNGCVKYDLYDVFGMTSKYIGSIIQA